MGAPSGINFNVTQGSADTFSQEENSTIKQQNSSGTFAGRTVTPSTSSDAHIEFPTFSSMPYRSREENSSSDSESETSKIPALEEQDPVSAVREIISDLENEATSYPADETAEVAKRATEVYNKFEETKAISENSENKELGDSDVSPEDETTRLESKTPEEESIPQPERDYQIATDPAVEEYARDFFEQIERSIASSQNDQRDLGQELPRQIIIISYDEPTCFQPEDPFEEERTRIEDITDHPIEENEEIATSHTSKLQDGIEVDASASNQGAIPENFDHSKEGIENTEDGVAETRGDNGMIQEETENFPSQQRPSNLARHVQFFANEEGFINAPSIAQALKKLGSNWISSHIQSMIIGGAVASKVHPGCPILTAFKSFTPDDMVHARHPSSGKVWAEDGSIDETKFAELLSYAQEGKEFLSEDDIKRFRENAKVRDKAQDSTGIGAYAAKLEWNQTLDLFVDHWELLNDKYVPCITFNTLRQFFEDSTVLFEKVVAGELPIAKPSV